MNSNEESIQKQKHNKIFFIFLFFIFLFFIFISSIFRIIFDEQHTKIPHISKEYLAFRGSIYSSDSKILSSSIKLYQASINSGWIYDNKKKIFAKLFSIYSNEKQKDILKKINSNAYVVLSKNLTAKQAQQMKILSRNLYKLGVLKTRFIKNRFIYYGIETSQYAQKRVYLYKDAFTPILGYVQNKEVGNFISLQGEKGLENFYDSSLMLITNAKISGNRDIGSNVILDGDSKKEPFKNGYDLILNMPLSLQVQVEKILTKYKKEFLAKEVIVAIMQSKNGKLLSVASSNRYNPSKISKKDYKFLNPTFTEIAFEPGSIIKPILLSKLIDEKIVSIDEKIKGHNGKFKLGKKIITDEHKRKIYTIEDIIVQSSNIAMAQLSLRVSASQVFGFLHTLGFMQNSGIDLKYENAGAKISISRLEKTINKATIFYGYGISVNFMQMLKMYSMFNNDGISSSPLLVSSIINHQGQALMTKTNHKRLISKKTAEFMKNALIQTTQKGTTIAVKTDGLIIGAKTGTAHIYKNGKYANDYMSSVFGFVNDKKHKYTIGVSVFEPKKKHFASQTAAKVFKSLVDLMVKNKYLTLAN